MAIPAVPQAVHYLEQLEQLERIIREQGADSPAAEEFLRYNESNLELRDAGRRMLKRERESLRERRVLAVISASDTPLAMPAIEVFCSCLGGYPNMEVRQQVWALIGQNRVESTNDLKFQPAGGCNPGRSESWSQVLQALERLGEAKAALGRALSRLDAGASAQSSS